MPDQPMTTALDPNAVPLTDAQAAAIDRLKERWPGDAISAPQPYVGGGCVLVSVTSRSSGAVLWLGIETDGYTHS